MKVVFSWLKAGCASQKCVLDIAETIYNPRMRSLWDKRKGAASPFKTGSKRSACNLLESNDSGSEKCSRLPIHDIMVWHSALEKELMEFAEDARRLRDSAADLSAKLSFISAKSKFLMDVRIFYRYSFSSSCLWSSVIVKLSGLFLVILGFMEA